MRRVVSFAFGFIAAGCLLSCSDTVNNCHYDYFYSEDGKTVLTLIQYINHKEPESRGIYIVYGKRRKDGILPTTDYVKVDYQTDPIWVKFGEDGKIEIIYSAGNVLENHLVSDSLTVTKVRNEEEFESIVGEDIDKYQEIITSRLKYW